MASQFSPRPCCLARELLTSERSPRHAGKQETVGPGLGPLESARGMSTSPRVTHCGDRKDTHPRMRDDADGEDIEESATLVLGYWPGQGRVVRRIPQSQLDGPPWATGRSVSSRAAQVRILPRVANLFSFNSFYSIRMAVIRADGLPRSAKSGSRGRRLRSISQIRMRFLAPTGDSEREPKDADGVLPPHNKKVGPCRDYLFGERVGILLGLFPKVALAWQVFAGPLQ
jgi:Heliorhodopsin